MFVPSLLLVKYVMIYKGWAHFYELLLQEIARDLIERKLPGSIVNISSQASAAALRDHSVYCSTKAAVDGLTRVMAMELGPHQVKLVN